MKTRLVGSLLAAVVFTCVNGAQAAIITFTADAAGAKPNGFAAVGHPGVTFDDTLGANLQVQNFGVQSDGQGLAVFSDDASRLLMIFGSMQTALSLDFGNDDSAFLGGAPVFALLEIFNGIANVGSVLMAANNDDIMNQTIAIAFLGGFDSARFTYVNAGGSPLNLIEVVDNITYDVGVPEPASLALVGFGLLGLGLRRRKAK